MMSKFFPLCCLPIALFGLAVAAPVAAGPESDLFRCQKTVAKQADKYLKAYGKHVDKCLEHLAGAKIRALGADPTDAFETCIGVMLKVNGCERDNIEDKFLAAVEKRCDGLGDAAMIVGGVGSPVQEAIELRRLAQWCGVMPAEQGSSTDGHFSPEDSVGQVMSEWRRCVLDTQKIAARTALVAP